MWRCAHAAEDHSYIRLSLGIKLNISEIKVQCVVVYHQETASFESVSNEPAELLH
jgi:hypothetical protein